MGDPYTTAHQFRTQAQKDTELELMGRMVAVAEKQEQTSRVAQWVAWVISGLSTLVAAGSLWVAVLALNRA